MSDTLFFKINDAEIFVPFFRVALDQGNVRGWYSYLDMSTILENLIFQEFLVKYLTSTGKVSMQLKAAFHLRVFHTFVYARKGLTESL